MSRSQTVRRLTTQLDQVRAAIDQVELNGQSFSLDGITYSRANLSALYKREAFLEKKIGRASGTRAMVQPTRFTGGGYL